MTRLSAALLLALGLVIAAPLPAPAQAQDLLDRLTSGLKKDKASEQPSEEEVGLGLKEALRVATNTVVGQLGREDGFNLDEVAHIRLPKRLRRAGKVLRKVGMGHLAEDLELRLNRAAEVATPRARAIFWNSIKQMTLRDVMDIYRGPDDAATQYFRRTMTPQLVEEMRPVIDGAMGEVGAIAAYDRFMGRYSEVPLVPDVKTDLTDYVMRKTLDGIFHYLAVEEAAIRRNPLKRTTDLLKKVFGALT